MDEDEPDFTREPPPSPPSSSLSSRLSSLPSSPSSSPPSSPPSCSSPAGELCEEEKEGEDALEQQQQTRTPSAPQNYVQQAVDAQYQKFIELARQLTSLEPPQDIRQPAKSASSASFGPGLLDPNLLRCDAPIEPNVARLLTATTSSTNPNLRPLKGDLVEILYTAIDDDASEVRWRSMRGLIPTSVLHVLPQAELRCVRRVAYAHSRNITTYSAAAASDSARASITSQDDWSQHSVDCGLELSDLVVTVSHLHPNRRSIDQPRRMTKVRFREQDVLVNSACLSSIFAEHVDDDDDTEYQKAVDQAASAKDSRDLHRGIEHRNNGRAEEHERSPQAEGRDKKQVTHSRSVEGFYSSVRLSQANVIQPSSNAQSHTLITAQPPALLPTTNNDSDHSWDSMIIHEETGADGDQEDVLATPKDDIPQRTNDGAAKTQEHISDANSTLKPQPQATENATAAARSKPLGRSVSLPQRGSHERSTTIFSSDMPSKTGSRDHSTKSSTRQGSRTSRSSGRVYANTHIHRPQWLINYSELKVEETIGHGGFSVVMKGHWRGEVVAVKRLYTEICQDSKPEVRLLQEAELLHNLRHRNIIQLKAACVDAPNFCLVLEYALLGALTNHIHDTLAPDRLLDWTTQVARGMHYLHHEAPIPLVHRDLKAANILVTTGHTLKISDFGLAREHTHTTRVEQAGTYAYMSPESIRLSVFSKASDVWSYGVVCWSMLTCKVPYEGLEGLAIAYGVGTKTLKLPIPDECPSPFRKLLEDCWEFEPHNRPTFAQILRALEEPQSTSFSKTPRQSFMKLQQTWKKRIEEGLAGIQSEKKALIGRELDLMRREEELKKREERVAHMEQELATWHMAHRDADSHHVQPERRERSQRLTALLKKRRSKHLPTDLLISPPQDFRHIVHVGALSAEELAKEAFSPASPSPDGNIPFTLAFCRVSSEEDLTSPSGSDRRYIPLPVAADRSSPGLELLAQDSFSRTTSANIPPTRHAPQKVASSSSIFNPFRRGHTRSKSDASDEHRNSHGRPLPTHIETPKRKRKLFPMFRRASQTSVGSQHQTHTSPQPSTPRSSQAYSLGPLSSYMIPQHPPPPSSPSPSPSRQQERQVPHMLSLLSSSSSLSIRQFSDSNLNNDMRGSPPPSSSSPLQNLTVREHRRSSPAYQRTDQQLRDLLGEPLRTPPVHDQTDSSQASPTIPRRYSF
eukprot:m.195544 g.195544  ORF g.195544 m.195544 type:complete len:1199 (+) comp16805_c1_seq1:190-3786(+)